MKVSIIIPFWNVADYVDRCMRSVTAQTHSDLEIIAVDNASTDGTGEKLKKWADADSRIKIITMDENTGPGPARNAALDTATGEYICFVDGDDCISPFYTEKLLGWASDNDCKIALCGYSLNDGKTPPESCAVSLELNYPEIIGARDYFERLYTDKEILYVVVWNKIYHRSIFEGVRFADMLNEDDEIIRHVIDKTDKIAVCYDSLYFYTVRQGSIMKSSFRPEKMAVFGAYEDRIDYFDSKGWYDLSFMTMRGYMVKCLEMKRLVTDDVENAKGYRLILNTMRKDMMKRAAKCPVRSKRFLLRMRYYLTIGKFKEEDRAKLLFGKQT